MEHVGSHTVRIRTLFNLRVPTTRATSQIADQTSETSDGNCLRPRRKVGRVERFERGLRRLTDDEATSRERGAITRRERRECEDDGAKEHRLLDRQDKTLQPKIKFRQVPKSHCHVPYEVSAHARTTHAP
jgi:hypothetical protein